MTDFDLLRGRLVILAEILDANQSVHPARELDALVTELEQSLRPINQRGSKVGSVQYLFGIEQRAKIRDVHQRLLTVVRRRNADGQMILEALQDALAQWPAS